MATRSEILCYSMFQRSFKASYVKISPAYDTGEMNAGYITVLKNRAAKVINRIKHEMMVTTWETLAPNAVGLRVTASFNAELRKDETIQQWLHRADMAAYAAKDGGRNALRTYSSLTHEEKKRANRKSIQARVAPPAPSTNTGPAMTPNRRSGQ